MSNNDNTADPGDVSQVDPTVKTPENLKEIDEIKQTLKRKFDEVSEKLQSIEASISKIPKIENDEKSIESTENEADSSKNSSNSIESTVSKAIQKSEKRFVLKNVFKDVENFEEGVSYITKFETHFNVDSSIHLKRSDGHLAFFVSIRGSENATEWSVETKVDLKIDGPNQKSQVLNFEHRYEKDEGWGFPEFLKWDEMKNEYLVDGNLTVEAHVEIIETSGIGKEKIRTFDESQKDVSDLVVSVRNTKFYVAKMFLAAQSSFFKALLLGNFAESKKSEITLTGIDPTDFHYFLEVLYGEWAMDAIYSLFFSDLSLLPESTVEGVALLADMYDAPTAIRRCESFLLNESKKSLKKKLQMATRYHLENLKKKCLEEIKTATDLRSVLPADLNDLDPKVMSELFKKSISFH
ncbi:hypothetical protein B9Z55_006649 [Caenorhabditis nigoni]|uniref:BTB domain-containing protein n=1 Tax=Caenorhabditis nigoni TaxID=1611254 RepID=A0A2G5V5Z4_9PELO|nr:hypothetical protein B9Z55_006649 [Caenorhabditis nigoni]